MRRFWVIVLCALGLLGLIATTMSTTALLTVLNKREVVRASEQALKNKSVQDRLTNDVAVAVLKNMPAAGRTEAATVIIRKSARDVVTDPAFRPLWAAAVGAAYDNVMDGRSDSIALNPDQLTGLVRGHLADQSPQLVALLAPSAELNVAVTTSKLPDLRMPATITRITPYIGAGIAVLTYGLAFAISRRRPKTLRGSGWWILVTGAVLVALMLTAPTLLLPMVRSSSADLGTAIAGMGWRLWVPAAGMAALGLFMAVLGIVLARRAPENRITRTVIPEPEVAEGQPPVDLWDCRV